MRANNSTVLGSLLAVSMLAACYVGGLEEVGESAFGGADSGTTTVVDGALSANGQMGSLSGLPCDVSRVIQANRCLDCHGAAPSSPMSLISYENLVAPSKSDPSMKVAEKVVLRMRDAARPMPPQGLAPASEADVIQAWIASGYRRGECGAAAGTDGAAAAPLTVQCTSGNYWTDNNKGDKEMNPGKACVTCHTQRAQGEDEPPKLIGGTVYPTFAEPDLCDGFSGAAVVINDSAGRLYTLTSNAAGNFFLNPGSPVTFPIRAKVVHNGKERIMNTPQVSGDCNSCHTERGINGAPGRIALP